MCAGCIRSVEAMVIAGAAGAVVVTNAWEARADRREGVTPIERAQRNWLRNKAFMEELGLDPVEVLGPPPRQPIPAGAPRRPAAPAAAELPFEAVPSATLA